MNSIPLCPITQQPFRDPWMDPEGNTYEHDAIFAWVQAHGTSPLTRSPLQLHQLVPNRALRDLIEAARNPNVGGSGGAVVADEEQLAPPDQEGAHSVTAEAWQLPVPEGGMTVQVQGPNRADTRMQPAHICCVIDVSGSMGDLASVPGKESDGLNLLDVVKHATRTILASLGAQDRLSIVSFSTDAQVVVEAVRMDANGKSLAKAALDALWPDGSTNLAAGVHLAGTHFSTVFVLTDGVPSDTSLDYAGAMRRQLEKQPLFGSVHTFGFGYQLDSKLLGDLAREGDGTFSFIPDAGMVGTIFINALANCRTVFANHVRLVVPRSLDMLGQFRGSTREEEKTFYLGSLRYGPTTSYVLTLPEGVAIPQQCTLLMDTLTEQNVQIPIQVVPTTVEEDAYKLYQQWRSQISTDLFLAVQTNADAKTRLQQWPTRDNVGSKRKEYPPLDALMQDVEGQVTLALSREDWFQRWGRHYLLSLAFAHSRQQCNNFKDPGVQHYGSAGVLFTRVQTELNDLFLTLPPPMPRAAYPSGTVGNGGGGGAGFSMAAYHNANGICFHPCTPVTLMTEWDGCRCVVVSELKQGDWIQTQQGPAQVVCVVETRFPQKQPGTFLCPLAPNVWVTPYHPMRMSSMDAWQFPKDLVQAKWISCQAVYNLVLDRHHSITLGNNSNHTNTVEAVTLGHGMQGDSVVEHAYFGSERILKDLQRFPGWQEGRVVLHANEEMVQRCPQSGRVCGIHASP